MARLVEMPKLSPTMEEGQIATWHVKEGDRVEVDDLLAEVETDKATMEFRAFDAGVVLKILAAAGDVVKLGDPVAIIGAAGDDIAALVAEAGGRSDAPRPEAAPAPAPPAAASPPAAPSPAPAPAPPPAPATRAASVGPTGRVKASPYVRKLARERDLDLHAVAGSGPGGRIVAADLAGARATPAPAPAVAPTASPSREPEVRPLSMMRKTIARRLTESKQTVPHFYLTIDVDAGPLVALRKQLNADLAEAPTPVKVSFNDLVIKAAAIAIGRAPAVNAQFTETALVYHRRVDISVAVAVDEGLVTPVVRNADQKSVLAISQEVRDLAARARDKKLGVEEMTNGTFSISNLGMYGIDEFAAVINPPEGAILAVGSIRAEPVVKDGAVVPGHRMKLTLSCDHRVVDGAVGAEFLSALRSVLERPTQILVS
ncbi:MAG: pyruvate dehydrogenase complex dihydrolipoamide acetyltransferase [Polyangiaceae bacterium]